MELQQSREIRKQNRWSKKAEICSEALSRATTGQSQSNYRAIISGFRAMGINEAEILPRENCFTFNAWFALGRVVKKGEHGVKVFTFISFDEKKQNENGEIIKVSKGSKPCRTTVFHISQTEAISKPTLKRVDFDDIEPENIELEEEVESVEQERDHQSESHLRGQEVALTCSNSSNNKQSYLF